MKPNIQRETGKATAGILACMVLLCCIIPISLYAQPPGVSLGYQADKYRTLNSDARYSSAITAASACEAYTWQGVTYTQSGTYTHTTLTPAGCILGDKLVLDLHHASTSMQQLTAAMSYTWAANNMTYTASGTYTHTLINSAQCDSLLSLQLTIVPAANALTLHCLVQGYWSGTQMQPVLTNQGRPASPGDCDSVDISLHQAVYPYTPVCSQRAPLDRNGLVYCLFTTLIPGSYYLVVRHRNALETWSASPLAFGVVSVNYDFTIAATQAYGGNQVLVSAGKYAFFSGDLNRDENIDLLDLNLVEAGIVDFQSGYVSTDLNGDGNVDLLDLPVLDTNISNFIFSQHP